MKVGRMSLLEEFYCIHKLLKFAEKQIERDHNHDLLGMRAPTRRDRSIDRSDNRPEEEKYRGNAIKFAIDCLKMGQIPEHINASRLYSSNTRLNCRLNIFWTGSIRLFS